MAMAIVKLTSRKIFLTLTLFLALLVAPSFANAATLTKTTVTVKVNKDWGELTNDYQNYYLYIQKDGLTYRDTTATIGTDYIVFKRAIDRCGLADKSSSGWAITIYHKIDKYKRTILDKAQICGDANYTMKANGDVIRTDTDTTCSACPVTTTPETKIYTLKGELEKTSNIYKLNPSSGDDLILGTSPNFVKWDATDDVWVTDAGTPKVGSQYSCDFKGTRANPTDERCRFGSESPDEKDKNTDPDPTDPPDPNDDDDDDKKTPTPIVVGFSGSGIPTIGIDRTRCPAGSTAYTSGLLKGIPCGGTIKTLDEALILVKNVIMIFLLPLVGTLFLIMLIIGGILYITSRGNTQQLERAKKTLTAAIIGLLIVTLSYTIIAIFANVIGGGIT